MPYKDRDLRLVLAEKKREVDCFAEQHPDLGTYQKEICRLIQDYGASLEGAYRVAKERGRR